MKRFKNLLKIGIIFVISLVIIFVLLADPLFSLFYRIFRGDTAEMITLILVLGLGLIATNLILKNIDKILQKTQKEIKIQLETDPDRLPTDGKSISKVLVRLTDENNELINAQKDVNIRLSASKGEISEFIIIKKGNSTTTTDYKSPYETGEAHIYAKSDSATDSSTKIELYQNNKLRLSSNQNNILADGKSSTQVIIEHVDPNGRLIESQKNLVISLSTSLGTIDQKITLEKGSSHVTANLTSSRKAGRALITATAKDYEEETISIEFTEKKRYCMHCGEKISIDASICPKCGKGPPSSTDAIPCATCGEIIPNNALYCSECGARQPKKEN
jgi:hypothetical protein